ncbi:MAG: hypothetical protein H0X51_00040 [Parachlamydiaceae bacterium]|nr:hypothetical protein [Parachlamydiaceae bacterium]
MTDINDHFNAVVDTCRVLSTGNFLYYTQQSSPDYIGKVAQKAMVVAAVVGIITIVAGTTVGFLVLVPASAFFTYGYQMRSKVDLVQGNCGIEISLTLTGIKKAAKNAGRGIERQGDCAKSLGVAIQSLTIVRRARLYTT